MSENKVTDPTTGEQVEVIDVQLYALNLGDDGRVLSATEDKYGAEGQPRVATLPSGETPEENDISNYRYVGGEFIYDPLPQPEPPEPVETADDVLNALLGITATDEEVSGDE